MTNPTHCRCDLSDTRLEVESKRAAAEAESRASDEQKNRLHGAQEVAPELDGQLSL